MKQAPEHLSALIEPIIEGLGYECVGIEYHPHIKHGVLRIYIDKVGGILLDDCSKVSHQISGILDVEDPIPGNYQLEISSPGTDRPFFKLNQFEAFIGSTVKIHLFSAINNRKKLTGVIQKVVQDTVFLLVDNEIVEIPFQAMSKARLVPIYNVANGEHSGK